MHIQKFYPEINLNINIEAINIDSKIKSPNSIFVCINGHNYDSHDYIDEAISNGAIFIIATRKININIPYTIVDDSLDELARISAIFYHHPSSNIKLIGVTGTDGKTTISTVISNCLDKCGYIGTNGISYLDFHLDTKNTTPSSLSLNTYLNYMLKQGISSAAIEVSSQAILNQRINYLNFSIAIYSNLSHEHLDTHQSMENYFLCKTKLFTMLNQHDLAIINIDDEYGERLVKMTKAKVITYSITKKATLQARNISYNLFGSSFDLIYKYRIYKHIETNLIGKYNISNLLAVIGVLFDYHIPFAEIRKKLKSILQIDGRMHIIKSEKCLSIIDFAHTPNGLKSILETISDINKGNIILILGAAGNKDKSKRSSLGRIASEMADFVIFTEEDSYDEPLEEIINDLTSELTKRNYIIIPNRKEAIKYGVKMANYNDCLLITGKGNEKTMTKQGIVYDYNDLVELKKHL